MESSLQKPLQEHLGVFLFALFISVIVAFVAWYRSYFKLPEFDRNKIKVNFAHLLVAFAIYFFVAMIASAIAYGVISSTSPEEKAHMAQQINAVKAWINLFTMGLIFTGFMVYLRIMSEQVRITVIGEGSYHGKWNNFKNVLMGIVSLMISFPLVIATGQLANMVLILIQKNSHEQVAVKFLKSTYENPVVYLVSILFVVIIIPTIEEILFRGFLQNYLAKFFGQIGAILTCSLIFAFFHFSKQQGWGNLEIVPSLFVLATFAGFIYFRQKSIYASIGLHASFNGLNVLMMALSQKGTI